MMTDTFRALCAELLDEVVARPLIRDHELIARARAALADEPAVPEGKKPTRDELWELWLRLNNELPDRPAAVAEFWEHAQIDARARAVRVRWGKVAPPADGEVAELVAWLQEEADDYECIGCEDSAAKCKRAAELLQRQVVVPVSVSERPWEREGWCDVEGRFWAEHISRSGVASWRCAAASDLGGWAVRCLPAHALPQPEVGE